MPFTVVSGGRKKDTDRQHRCELPGAFRFATRAVLQCLECGKEWIRGTIGWVKYDPKDYKLKEGEYPKCL